MSRSNPEYIKLVNIKEYILEVQGILVGKLAAEENYYKKIIILFSFYIVDFEERVKKVEEVI